MVAARVTLPGAHVEGRQRRHREIGRDGVQRAVGRHCRLNHLDAVGVHCTQTSVLDTRSGSLVPTTKYGLRASSSKALALDSPMRVGRATGLPTGNFPWPWVWSE